MTDTAQQTVTTPEAPDAPGFFILDHFVADFSMENPFGRLPAELLPDLHHGLSVFAKVTPLEKDDHRVEIFVQIEAAVVKRVFFVMEMAYRADVRLHLIPEDEVDEFLHVKVPEALTATLRAVIEQNGRFAGYPAINIAELDFAGAYAQRKFAH
ncbi:MAG TPA: protein-export chaperone SecB [Rhodocyclaceae bacterium]